MATASAILEGDIAAILAAMTKVLVSFDDDLLRRIDRAAAEEHLSRSAFLRRLAGRALGEEKGPGASPRARAAIDELRELASRYPGEGDGAAAIRAERDLRDGVSQRW